MNTELDDPTLLRYTRQIMLTPVDVAGQARLVGAHVLIVGLGGLGSPVALYLAAAGVGRLTLVDFDTVDLTNLQRQIVHRDADVGRAKVESARDTLAALNPLVRVEAVKDRLDEDRLWERVAAADLVVDCTDNFATRHALNRACLKHGRPLVSAAAIRFEGQVTVFDPRRAESPCYHCLYPEGEELGERCSQTGVFTPLVGVVGSLQAAEAMKLIIGIGEPLVGRLLIVDTMSGEFRELRLPRDPDCPVCGPARPRA